MNEKILNKLREIENKESISEALSKVSMTSKDAPMTYTPVNKDTFYVWTEQYKEKMRKIKEEMKTENDLKLSGRQIFEQKKAVIEELNIDEIEEDDEEFKDQEGSTQQEEDDNYQYDKALYVQEELEDVDFE